MEKHDASVSEMVRDAAPDKTFHDELEGHLADYNVSRTLCALRCSQNITQAELAKLAGCTQSKISRIENSRNDRLKLEDLANYARAFNMQVSIDFAQESTAADAIGRLAHQVRNSLNEVAEKARIDGTAADGAKKPYETFLFDMLDLFMENLEGLRTRHNGAPDSGETTGAGNGRPMDPVGRSEPLTRARGKNGVPAFRIHTPIDIIDENGRSESRPNRAEMACRNSATMAGRSPDGLFQRAVRVVFQFEREH